MQIISIHSGHHHFMITQIAILLLLAGLYAVPVSAADEREVFFGLPTTKYEVSVEGSQRNKLTSDDSTKNAVRIVKIGDDYIWKTQENRKLIYSYAGHGDFHYFIDPLRWAMDT